MVNLLVKRENSTNEAVIFSIEQELGDIDICVEIAGFAGLLAYVSQHDGKLHAYSMMKEIADKLRAAGIVIDEENRICVYSE